MKKEFALIMISLKELEEEKKEITSKAYSWGLGRKGAIGHGDEVGDC